MGKMTIAIGNDHAAVDFKNEIIKYLESKDFEVINVGTDTKDSCDYPVPADKVSKLINEGKAKLGILICGTGIGISIAANKHKGIRAALCENTTTAKFTRLHNNANVLCMGARIIGIELAKDIVDIFLTTEYEGGRHQKRLDLITQIEDNGEL